MIGLSSSSTTCARQCDTCTTVQLASSHSLSSCEALSNRFLFATNIVSHPDSRQIHIIRLPKTLLLLHVLRPEWRYTPSDRQKHNILRIWRVLNFDRRIRRESDTLSGPRHMHGNRLRDLGNLTGQGSYGRRPSRLKKYFLLYLRLLTVLDLKRPELPQPELLYLLLAPEVVDEDLCLTPVLEDIMAITVGQKIVGKGALKYTDHYY